MSAFFGARAPELVPENVQDLNIKPARKMPLNERSLSDLNAKPTIRLVNPSSPDVYNKTPFPKKTSQIFKPSSPSKLKQQENYLPISILTSDSRPTSRDGPSVLQPRPLHLNKRASVSTTNSNADTLVADSLFSPTSARFSLDSIAKGTPAPWTAENTPGPLEPLEERDTSMMDLNEQDHDSDPLEPPAIPRRNALVPSSSMYSSPYDELRPPTPPRLRRRSSSGPPFEVVQDPSSEPERGLAGSSQESIFDTIPARAPRSESHHIIRYMSSSESIRPQFASVRPPAIPSRSGSSAWMTDDGEDDIAPLSISGSCHLHSASLNSYPSMSRLDKNHLSTIESESDHPISSRYEQGSEGNNGQTWPRRRRTTIASSAYSESIVSPISSPRVDRSLQASSSYGSLPDQQRDDSAMPPPLFSSSSVPIPQRPFSQANRDRGASDELDDTICELQPPTLREKRSGYFVRQRSQTDLRPASKRSNHSLRGENDRWSVATFSFPQWAWSFYSGRSGLASANASKVTLGGIGGPVYGSANHSRVTLGGAQYCSANNSRFSLSRPGSRARHGRSETVDSFATRPNSTHSNWETVYTESPASRLVPSIFRPRNRARAQTDVRQNTGRMNTTDDLGIYQIPAEGSEPQMSAISSAPVTPAKSSKRSTLRNVIRAHQAAVAPKPTVRNVTQHSVLAHGPAVPMSTDPSYISLPHLVQNQRLSRNISLWRVPSIDEPFPRDILGRGNRQVVCFCLGFICPLMWMLAAFLPLPQRPQNSTHADESVWSVLGRHDSVSGVRGKEREGLDAAITDDWSWMDERKFLKARWWRTLNRIMAVIGVGILALVIALAVVAAK